MTGAYGEFSQGGEVENIEVTAPFPLGGVGGGFANEEDNTP